MCAQKLNPWYKQQNLFKEHATHRRSHLSIATTRSWGSNGSRNTVHAILTRSTSVSSRSLKHKTTIPFKTPEQRGSCEHVGISGRTLGPAGPEAPAGPLSPWPPYMQTKMNVYNYSTLGKTFHVVIYRIVSYSFVLIYKLSSEPLWKRHLQQVRADQTCQRILCVPCGLYLQPHQPLLCLPWLQQDPGWR